MKNYITNRQLKIKDIKNDIEYIMDWETEMKQEHDKTINEIKTELNSLKITMKQEQDKKMQETKNELNSLKITMKQEQDKKIQEIKTELNLLKNSQKIESNKNMSIKPSIKKRGI